MNTRMASKMLVTGTFSICALSRSTSTKTCGVAAAKVVKTLAMPGVRLASATNSWVMLRELLGRHAELVLQAHGEAGRRAHAAYRRRNEHQRLRPLDLGKLAAHVLGDLVNRLPQCVPLLEVVEHQEQQAGVGRVGERGAVAPRKGVGILDTRRRQNQVGGLPHHLVRRAEGCARRKLDRDHQDRAVDGRDEPGRKARHEPPAKTSSST